MRTKKRRAAGRTPRRTAWFPRTERAAEDLRAGDGIVVNQWIQRTIRAKKVAVFGGILGDLPASFRRVLADEEKRGGQN